MEMPVAIRDKLWAVIILSPGVEDNGACEHTMAFADLIGQGRGLLEGPAMDPETHLARHRDDEVADKQAHGEQRAMREKKWIQGID
jgi:hypothetical protein